MELEFSHRKRQFVKTRRPTNDWFAWVHCIAGISQITRKTTSTTNCTKGVEKLEWFQPITPSKHAKNTVSKKTVFQTEEEEEEKDSISNSFETSIRIHFKRWTSQDNQESRVLLAILPTKTPKLEYPPAELNTRFHEQILNEGYCL